VPERRIAARKLAAILAADMAGYSRLTRADEEGTIARLRTLRRDFIDPVLDAHGGQMVKTTGDGLLMEFGSVVDAVRCAVALQRGMTARNRDVPADNRILFRMGINLGDVVVEGADLLGDGVNVASRLEGLAEAGGICLSGAAYEQVRDKLDLPFDDLGEKPLKNIVRPVHVYGLTESAVAALPDIPLPPPSRRLKSPASQGRPRRRLIDWLLWWQIDPAELARQVAGYGELRFVQSARGIALICSLVAGAETERFTGAAGLGLAAYIGVALWVGLGALTYLGQRWAPLAAMVLWTLQKLLAAVAGFEGGANRGLFGRGPHGGGDLVVDLVWWCIFMHVFYRAFRVEQERHAR
jgi:class 3 adenylate cyclase